MSGVKEERSISLLLRLDLEFLESTPKTLINSLHATARNFDTPSYWTLTFYQRRIIFWYDEDKEFEDKLDEVVLENAKFIALTGNNAFYVKKLLSVDDLTTNYLVYSPLAYNRPDDNWFLDVELYSEEFRADLISIWMDEMGLISNPAMRKQVKNYRAYFNAKDRRLKVSTQNKVPETPAQLHMAVISWKAEGISKSGGSIPIYRRKSKVMRLSFI